MKKVFNLTLDLFTSVEDDLEKRQYIILAELKKISEQFQFYKIYPHLSQLIELRRVLKDVIARLQDLRSKFPKQISKLDWVNRTIEHEVIFTSGTDISSVEDLIDWALPHIENVIEEGVAIHDFVESELTVEQVGILPSYRDEGYLFVPDNQKKSLNLFRFEVSIFRSTEDQYRALKTRFLKQLEQDRIKLSPGSIKLDLIREQSELPNPATYAFTTDLDFPFETTIFPVAKRRLMHILNDEIQS
ncbi:hypothetical protein [Rhodohalobacter sp.]|uniref:hypothetical protein n=1 Tax=Rhodohalobacter sp. TaxID=1974210 RepID=UPI002ACE4709|nr:hypothetical protein [Rhodohalobacter sp.]MDZ7756889.1 hypothetical protein [Rhodohalobacter sp.]